MYLRDQVEKVVESGCPVHQNDERWEQFVHIICAESTVHTNWRHWNCVCENCMQKALCISHDSIGSTVSQYALSRSMIRISHLVCIWFMRRELCAYNVTAQRASSVRMTHIHNNLCVCCTHREVCAYKVPAQSTVCYAEIFTTGVFGSLWCHASRQQKFQFRKDHSKNNFETPSISFNDCFLSFRAWSSWYYHACFFGTVSRVNLHHGVVRKANLQFIQDQLSSSRRPYMRNGSSLWLRPAI